MTRADQLVERGDQIVDRLADRVREFADRVAAEQGPAAKLAEPLIEDSAFLRKLKPSLIRARAKGETPIDSTPDTVAFTQPTSPPPPAGPKQKGQGPNPLLIVAGAFVAGIVLAKVIDWRGYAHPRD
jgi:hypothetical protein